VEASKQESVIESIPQTDNPVTPSDLRVGDELVCTLATGRSIVTRVKRLKRDVRGELVGFFPCAQLGVDSSVAIDVGRIVKAWRSPESKHTAIEPAR
jgi:hypothetical protein